MIQFANNNQWEDYLLAGATLKIDFSGKFLELKYFVRSEKEGKFLIQNKEKIREIIEKIRNDWRINKIFCRFFFGKYKPTIDLQKELVEFQKDVFDEVAVHLINTKLDDFKQVYEYAINKDLAVSPVVDIATLENHLNQLLIYLNDNKPDNIRFVHRKISKFLARYFFVSNQAKKYELKIYLTGCPKRCSIDGFKNIDVSIIAKGLFEFDGCCLDYRPANKRKGKRGFANTMSVFNLENYEWSEEKNGDFRNNRTQNFLKLDSAKISQDEINKRPMIKKLFEILISQKR